jgi:D-alanine transaminase
MRSEQTLLRIAYVNGRYLPYRHAMIHIEDRGYQFSDGVYEVCEVRDGHIIDERRHLARLTRSLDEIRIAMPMPPSALAVIMRECLQRNRVRYGILYLQITRGVARRDHAFPPPSTKPSVIVTARHLDFAANERIAAEGVAVVTVPDNRWERVDIKSISLLPNVLAKQAARERGAKEAWFVDRRGHITEGSSSNAWIVSKDGKVITPPADKGILRGITRTVLIDVVAAQGLELEERSFTPEEAYGAREAFLTSASQVVVPVVRIDDRPIGNGVPGSIATALRAKFHCYGERT